ncbi:MAG: hypothetical protein ACK4SY_10010 [Pyrobaculum sp.]
MEFDVARRLFAVGLILQIVPPVGLVLALVGAYGLSRHYGRRGIFWNLLYAAMVPLVVILAFLLMDMGILGEGVIFFVLTHAPLAWAFFMWRAYLNLSEASNVDSFKPAASLILVGALAIPAATWSLIGILLLIEATPLAPIATYPADKAATTSCLLGTAVMLIGHILAITGAFRLKPPTQL